MNLRALSAANPVADHLLVSMRCVMLWRAVWRGALRPPGRGSLRSPLAAPQDRHGGTRARSLSWEHKLQHQVRDTYAQQLCAAVRLYLRYILAACMT